MNQVNALWGTEKIRRIRKKIPWEWEKEKMLKKEPGETRQGLLRNKKILSNEIGAPVIF